jgi:hypothetical protein
MRLRFAAGDVASRNTDVSHPLQRLRQMGWIVANLFQGGNPQQLMPEIEQPIIDAMYAGFNAQREFTSEDISAALKRQAPLSVSQRETIGALHNWLREGRAQLASFREIRVAGQQFAPLQLGLKG